MEFVLHSINLGAEKIAMLLKVTFLEGQKRYVQLFSNNPPKTVAILLKRTSCAKSGDFENLAGSAVCYAWFVWDKKYKGEPHIRWIKC
jgi:hypothetical protein